MRLHTRHQLQSSLDHNYFRNFLLLLCAHSDRPWPQSGDIISAVFISLLTSWDYRFNTIINTQSDGLEIDTFLNEQIWADLRLPSPREAELTLLHFNKETDPICHRAGRVIYRLLWGHMVRYESAAEGRILKKDSVSHLFGLNVKRCAAGRKKCSDRTGSDIKGDGSVCLKWGCMRWL